MAAQRAAVELPPTLAPSDPDYTRERYDVKQAAAYLVVTPTTVYIEANAHALGHRKDGNRRRVFSQADLDAWRAARRVESEDRRPLRPVPRRATRQLAPLPLPKQRVF